MTTFNETKALQMMIYLTMLSGRTIDQSKLLSMMYLAERESMKKWGETMSGDEFISTPDGPTLKNLIRLLEKQDH